MVPFKKARQWVEREKALFDGRSKGGNEFDRYVPVEVRQRSLAMRNNGITPAFTSAHVELWVALSEVMGVEKFDEPIGWSDEAVKTHLFGQ